VHEASRSGEHHRNGEHRNGEHRELPRTESLDKSPRRRNKGEEH
jgi:hypothetical protein